MSDCLDFKMFRSSGATQSQVTEFQPFPEQLLTEYFMFGYDFEPSSWLADVNHYRKDAYNPINDLLNPLNVGPDEMLQQMSQSYIQEMLLKDKYQRLKDKERILKVVPPNLRRAYEFLYDSGALIGASNDRIDAQIANLVTGGDISDREAGELRQLVTRRDLLNQLANQTQSTNAHADIESVIAQISQSFVSRGLNPSVARGIALQGVSRSLDSVGLVPTPVWLRSASTFAEQYAEGMADASQNVGMGPRQQQFGAEVEQMERETGILQSGSTGFGTRSSAPLGVGDIFGGDMTSSGIRNSSYSTRLVEPGRFRLGTRFEGMGGATEPEARVARREVEKLDREEFDIGRMRERFLARPKGETDEEALRRLIGGGAVPPSGMGFTVRPMEKKKSKRAKGE